MNLARIHAVARSHSSKSGKLSKIELIKMIQTDEGNFDCFATACDGECDQVDCIWRMDCFDAAQQA